MAIDFTLTPDQRRLQTEARCFAHDVLSNVGPATRDLPTATERFTATRPFYKQAVEAGLLRRLVPAPLGGEGTGVIDMAVLAEEFHAVDVNVSLTLLGTMLGLFPVLLGGSAEQQRRLFAPFVTAQGTPLAAFCATEPGGSANFAAPRPAEGVRTVAHRTGGDDGEWSITGTKKWVSSATGWDGRGADLMTVVCRTDLNAPPEAAISVIAVTGPAPGITLTRAIESVGHRAHLQPEFRLDRVRAPAGNVIGPVGGGKALVEACFTGTAPIVGVFAVGLMRAAFDATLAFARTERRGGAAPIIEHQAVGYALADAKTAIEAVRALSWRAAQAVDAQSPGALELALHAKVFGSEAAVRVITQLMQVVGIDSYDRDMPLGGLLADALVLPLFDGGNMGVRRRQLHELLKAPDYDPLTTLAPPAGQ
ncbi:MAG: acyl-CoA dehydrogenase family protein [Acetobacteraceae bacterium]|nr:acyl-CoA dehydrogenase family protein [Acetobacteraceae bacterium]